MKKKKNVLLFVFIIYPYIVGFTPEASDSSSTILKIIVGRGSYADVSRDCEGNPITVVDIPFHEAAIELDHHSGNVRTGVKGGVTNLRDGKIKKDDSYWDAPVFRGSTIYYVSPDIGVHWKYIGINAGLIYFNDYFTPREDLEFDHKIMPRFSLRIGNPYTTYVTAGFMNNVPLISGGGLFDIGVGFYRPYPMREVWVGLGFFPYDSSMLIMKSDIFISQNVMLLPRGMIGLGSDSFEYGLSIGAAIRF